MKQENRIRTYPIRNLVIFLSISFIVSLTMVILFIFLKDELWVIRILIWIFCGLFTIASSIVLIYQLFFYVEVRDDKFIKHVLFGQYSISLRKIDYVRNQDGFYTLIVRDRPWATFSSNTTEGQQIIIYLEKRGVKINW